MDEQPIFDKIVIDDTSYDTLLTRKHRHRKAYVAKDPKKLTAFIPGVVRHVYVKKGQRVKRGDHVLILEAMKMQNDVPAPIDGIIAEIMAPTGSQVAKGDVLVIFE